MLRCDAHPGVVIEDHGAGIDPVRDVAIKQHDGRLDGAQGLNCFVMVLFRERQDQAVDTTALEQQNVLGIEIGAAFGIGEEQRIPALTESLFGACDELSEHRVRDVGEGEADRERPSPA